MLTWPTIPDVDSKTLQQAALWLYVWCVEQKIREVGGNNRGPWPDFFNESVGLKKEGAYPWCTSSAYCIFAEAARQKRCRNPFPKTGKAVEVRNRTEPICLVTNPSPGSIIVLDHGKAWAAELAAGKRLTDSGHIAIANATVTGDLSGNTNGAGSREGDRFAEKLWPDGGDAAAVHGGTIVAIFDFDLADQPPPGFT